METFNFDIVTQDNYQQDRQFEKKLCGVIRWKFLSQLLFVLWFVTSVGLTQARTHGHGEFSGRANSQTAGTAEQQIQIITNTLDKRIKETSPCLPPSCTQCATRITAAPSDGYNREYRDCFGPESRDVVNLTCYNCNGKCASVSREEVRSRMDFIHIPIQCPAPNPPAFVSYCDVVRLCQLHDLCHGGDCVYAGVSNVSCSCPPGRTGKYCNETAEQPKVPCKCFHSTLPFCSDDLPACNTVSHGHPRYFACQMMTVNATSRCVCNTTRQLDDSSGLETCSSIQMSMYDKLTRMSPDTDIKSMPETSGTGICKPSVSMTAGLTCMYWASH